MGGSFKILAKHLLYSSYFLNNKYQLIHFILKN
jgi:hypothetical protein